MWVAPNGLSYCYVQTSRAFSGRRKQRKLRLVPSHVRMDRHISIRLYVQTPDSRRILADTQYITNVIYV